MRQRRLQWGSGPRTVVLVHGYSDDAETWWQVGPALAELGWHVVAPDLRGHGLSPRLGRCSVDSLLVDLLDSIDSGADLVVGHSLGAALVNLAAGDLRTRQVILLDPPWGDLPTNRSEPPWERSVEQIRELNPLWSDPDVQVDLRSNHRLDPEVTAWLAGPDPLGGWILPQAPAVPSVVVLPEQDALVPPLMRTRLRGLGFAIRTLPHVGHVIHRDDPAAFIQVVQGDEAAASGVVHREPSGRPTVSGMFPHAEVS